jgi:hypothetical protein
VPYPKKSIKSRFRKDQFSTGLLRSDGHRAFDNDRKSKAAESAKDQKIEKLEAKLQRKDSVLAELMEEHVSLKKELGEI